MSFSSRLDVKRIWAVFTCFHAGLKGMGELGELVGYHKLSYADRRKQLSVAETCHKSESPLKPFATGHKNTELGELGFRNYNVSGFKCLQTNPTSIIKSNRLYEPSLCHAVVVF